MAHKDDGRFDMSRNFLATDKVPDTIFGYPVVSRREDYTHADIAFFRAHPEAGGYYEPGEGLPEDGTEEGAPAQGSAPAPGQLKNLLATDDVPESLFGFRIVGGADGRYTAGDLRFFDRHPEAGGYYDLGEGAPEGGTEEGAPVPASVSQAAKGGKTSELTEEQRVARVNAGIAYHPGFSKEDIEDMRRSAAFIADPKNAIRGLLVEGTLRHDAERPVFYSKNGWEDGQEGFQGDRFSMAHTLDDGRVVVFPSIYADKDGTTRLHTGRDAFKHYEQTGEHFGIYDSVENANRASVWSHHAGNAGWLKRIQKKPDTKPRGAYPGAWNSPGNVQMGDVEYDGESGSVKSRISKGTFLKFKTPQDGLNAMAQSIGQMVREKIPAGQFTIDDLVKVYAPKKDANDVDRYAKFVSEWTGIPRGQALDMSEDRTMALLLDAMVRQDSGHPHANWFTSEERKTAVEKMRIPARPRHMPKTEVKKDAKKK